MEIGVSGVDLLESADAGFSSLVQVFDGAFAQGNNGSVPVRELTLSTTAAGQFVRLNVFSIYGTHSYAEFGELAFAGERSVVPEPSTVGLILFGLTGLGLVSRQRRRRA